MTRTECWWSCRTVCICGRVATLHGSDDGTCQRLRGQLSTSRVVFVHNVQELEVYTSCASSNSAPHSVDLHQEHIVRSEMTLTHTRSISGEGELELEDSCGPSQPSEREDEVSTLMACCAVLSTPASGHCSCRLATTMTSGSAMSLLHVPQRLTSLHEKLIRVCADKLRGGCGI